MISQRALSVFVRISKSNTSTFCCHSAMFFIQNQCQSFLALSCVTCTLVYEIPPFMPTKMVRKVFCQHFCTSFTLSFIFSLRLLNIKLLELIPSKQVQLVSFTSCRNRLCSFILFCHFFAFLNRVSYNLAETQETCQKIITRYEIVSDLAVGFSQWVGWVLYPFDLEHDL